MLRQKQIGQGGFVMTKDGNVCHAVLIAALESLLSCCPGPVWVKAPATFIAKIASRFKRLPVTEREAFGGSR